MSKKVFTTSAGRPKRGVTFRPEVLAWLEKEAEKNKRYLSYEIEAKLEEAYPELAEDEAKPDKAKK